MNTDPNIVTNKPLGCTFCGSFVQGRVQQVQNPVTKVVENVCRWICQRCGNLVKSGKLE